jgi:site-specific DNA recombinase
MASMDVIDILQQQFFAAAQNDLMARMASGEFDTEAKKNKLIEAYLGYTEAVADLFWMFLVAGAGFEPAAFRL